MSPVSLREAHRILASQRWRPGDEKLPEDGGDKSPPPIDDETEWEDQEGDRNENHNES